MPTTSRFLSAMVAAAVTIGLGACGDDDDSADDGGGTAAGGSSTAGGGSSASSTATSPSGSSPTGDEEMCAPMQRLAEYNGQQDAIDQASGDWPSLQQALLDSREEADELYGDAIDVAPDEIRGQIETLRDFTADALDAAEDADSLEEFAEVFQDVPAEVASATTELDAFLQEQCGFGLTQG